MAWLLHETDVLASLEVASSFKARLIGLLGRDGIEGALLISPSRSIHTLGMRFDVDVALCDKDMVVIHTQMVKRHRVMLPRSGVRYVLEAEAGSFERWGLGPGDQLEVRQ